MIDEIDLLKILVAYGLLQVAIYLARHMPSQSSQEQPRTDPDDQDGQDAEVAEGHRPAAR